MYWLVVDKQLRQHEEEPERVDGVDGRLDGPRVPRLVGRVQEGVDGAAGQQRVQHVRQVAHRLVVYLFRQLLSLVVGLWGNTKIYRQTAAIIDVNNDTTCLGLFKFAVEAPAEVEAEGFADFPEFDDAAHTWNCKVHVKYLQKKLIGT